jgi:hypothetical protein
MMIIYSIHTVSGVDCTIHDDIAQDTYSVCGAGNMLSMMMLAIYMQLM